MREGDLFKRFNEILSKISIFGMFLDEKGKLRRYLERVCERIGSLLPCLLLLFYNIYDESAL